MQPLPKFRRQRAYLSELSLTQMHLRSPWVVAFYSFSFPGFGNLLQHRHIKAYILILWELFINNKAQINYGIYYTMIGQFDKAIEVLDISWLIPYVGVYLYVIWDSFRSTVEFNRMYLLADREDAPILPLKMAAFDINYLDQRSPWMAAVWSLLAPGLGHFYLHRVLTGILLLGFTLAILAFSNIPMGIYYTMLGQFQATKDVLNIQWTLYLPSIYLFVIYDAYVSCVEQNRLFGKELSRFLRESYQSESFRMPV